jgi:hypothetical protein
MIARIINLLLGVWLSASPAVLGYADPARTHDWVIGPVIASIACVAIWQVTRPLRWANLLLGIWLLAAPWVLGYDGSTAAGLNSMICGVAIALCSLHKGRLTHQYGGGWTELWRNSN